MARKWKSPWVRHVDRVGDCQSQKGVEGARVKAGGSQGEAAAAATGARGRVGYLGRRQKQGCCGSCGIRGCQVRRVAARVETRERSSDPLARYRPLTHASADGPSRVVTRCCPAWLLACLLACLLCFPCLLACLPGQLLRSTYARKPTDLPTSFLLFSSALRSFAFFPRLVTFFPFWSAHFHLDFSCFFPGSNLIGVGQTSV